MFSALTETQDRLLAAALAMLRPGGRLVYSVCSLQPEEGAERIEAALARGGVRHDPFNPSELAALPEALTADGFLRTHAVHCGRSAAAWTVSSPRA